MIGGFNKLFRNIASIKGKSEFEKRLIKASFHGDMKEPKEKHVVFILECIKGKHLELIRPKEALSKLFDRFFNNLQSISPMLKSLCILHRALQEEEISQQVAHKIKEKENLLYTCQTEDQTYGTLSSLLISFIDTKMQNFICEMYINYIKNLISFIIICQLFSISLKDLEKFTKTLSVKELFLIFSRIDTLIENILKIFEQKAYCHNNRLLHNIVYLLFVDLLKIYQSYYLLISVLLDKFENMSVKDSKRSFIIYLNFIKVNKEIRKMANSIITEFSIKLNIFFYDVDPKLIEALKSQIDTKEKEQSFNFEENQSNDSNFEQRKEPEQAFSYSKKKSILIPEVSEESKKKLGQKKSSQSPQVQIDKETLFLEKKIQSTFKRQITIGNRQCSSYEKKTLIEQISSDDVKVSRSEAVLQYKSQQQTCEPFKRDLSDKDLDKILLSPNQLSEVKEEDDSRSLDSQNIKPFDKFYETHIDIQNENNSSSKKQQPAQEEQQYGKESDNDNNFKFQRLKTFSDEKFFIHQQRGSILQPKGTNADTQTKTNVDESDDDDAFKSFYN